MSTASGSLAGKVAVVTGSSRGIGRATVLELASRGANVVVNYFRHREAGEATAEAARALGVKALAMRAHMGKRDQIGALFEATQREFGGVDILVCNAASGVFRPLLEVDDQGWDWTIAVTSHSALWSVQHAVPLMEGRGGGRIVTVGSIYADRVLPSYGMVGAAKGALEALTRYMAVELAPRGIIVNGVAPGSVPTDVWEIYLDSTTRATDAELIRRTPLGALVTPEQVAGAVLFLCTASGILGQTLVVDNGFSVVV